MIYVAHTEAKTRRPQNGNACDDRLTGPSAQLKSCLDQHPLAHAGGRNHSLVFGSTILRKSRSSLHLCAAGTTVHAVNRLWYGRALVALRTYPQWTLRSAAIEQCLRENGDTCPIKLGNPVQ